MNPDEQIALLKEIRDLLAANNERAQQESADYARYRETIKAMADEGELHRSRYYENGRNSARTAFRVQTVFAIVIIGILWLILTALTK